MAQIKFKPSNISAEAAKDTKILVTARKHQVAIRFGCASARCGTCAVKVSDENAFSPMQPNESALLKRMNLSTDGDVRLSCQARSTGERDCEVDISFQDTYSPDDLDGDGSL
jgi:ferredoxin